MGVMADMTTMVALRVGVAALRVAMEAGVGAVGVGTAQVVQAAGAAGAMAEVAGATAGVAAMGRCAQLAPLFQNDLPGVGMENFFSVHV